MTLEEARKRIKELDSGSGFFGSDYEAGWGDALNKAVEVLAKVEPVGNPDKLTLKELAHELRRLFRFKYLTVDPYADEITFWMDKPEWVCDSWWAGDSSYLFDFYANRLNAYLDLSEYKDADGNIDYSRCIVEVE